MSSYRKLFSYIGTYKKDAIFIPFFLVLQMICEVAIPYLMSYIIDVGIARHNLPILLGYGGGMVLLSGMVVVTGYASTKLLASVSAGIAKNLRQALLVRVCAFTARDCQQYTKASLLTRMTGDVGQIQQTLQVLGTLISAPLYIVFAILMTSQIHAGLAVVYLLAVPLFIVTVFAIIKASRPYFKRKAKSSDTMNRILMENLVGIRLVKSFVREEQQTGQFQRESQKVKEATRKAEQITNLNNPIQQLTVNICIIILLLFGGQGIMAGTIQVGELFCFLTYTGKILYQVTLISMIIVPIVSVQVYVERIMEILDHKPAVNDDDAFPAAAIRDGSLVFQHVSYDYDAKTEEEHRLLQNLDFRIADGSCVGVIGATASGKTTLISLIPRLLDTSSGDIWFGGTDIRKVPLEELRKQISCAMQKSILFAGTIRENLLWGCEDATEEAMKHAAKMACVDAYIMSLPDGYETRIEQGGVNVSGGQRQRLCLARALLKPAKLLILDDCTSALDRTTEQQVMEHICESYTDRTRIIISQKVAAMKRMDQILILDQGKIVGFGTHQELLCSCDIYRELYESQ